MGWFYGTEEHPDFPIYVTREHNGQTYALLVGTKNLLICLVLAQIAALLWLSIAVGAAVVTIINAIGGLF